MLAALVLQGLQDVQRAGSKVEEQESEDRRQVDATEAGNQHKAAGLQWTEKSH